MNKETDKSMDVGNLTHGSDLKHDEHGGHAHRSHEHDHECDHDHDHGSHSHNHIDLTSHTNQRRLIMALSVTGIVFIAEVVGGLISGSLALIGDAGHMLTDTLALGLALFALILARQSQTSTRTFGFYRAEIMAALTNGALLVLVAAYIIYEAYHRLFAPPEVKSGVMLIIAFIGLVANVIGMFILHGGSRHNLNMKGAFWHMLSDAVSSLGVVIAAIVISFTGWNIVDPIVSLLITVLILRGAISLLWESSNILLEAAPKHVDVKRVVDDVKKIPGALDMHDIHIWTISSGMYALSAHVLTDDRNLGQCQQIVDQIGDILWEKYSIGHTTLQLECEACQEGMECQLRRGAM
jgi:cobalt-zinc-cadmium efflux system protein